jgi:hypothetical protein
MNKYQLLFFVVFGMLTFSILNSRDFRVQKIPNGNKFSCANCHISVFGGGPRNQFGQAVESRVTPGGSQNFWDNQLASLDSDGDGFSNGEELQDPLGNWSTGHTNPGDFNMVSDPGDPNSHPTTTLVSNVNLPNEYKLLNNYPNPFNPSTKIAFDIPQSELVTLKVYNINGELIRNIMEENLPAGRFESVWNGKDNNGREVSSGVYIYRLTAGKFNKSARMILMK